jgi:ABC-type uncharacterized transport system permease subunit
MKKNVLGLMAAMLVTLSIFSCETDTVEKANISVALKVVGQSISDTILPKKDASGNAIPLKGTIKQIQ